MGKLFKWTLKGLCQCIDGRINNDFDFIIIVKGGTGIGKTTLAYKIVKRLKAPKQKFKPKRDLIYGREQVIKALSFYKKGVLVADELINVAYGRDFYIENQKKLIKGLNMYRDSQNVFIGCVPLFNDLDIQFQRICKLRLTIVRRGFALIQKPISSIFTRDPWDMKNNMKIESKWVAGKSKPKYAKLSTVVGYVTFNDLPKRQRELLKEIKRTKRSKVYNEDDELARINDPNTIFYNNLKKMLENKEINDMDELNKIVKVSNRKRTIVLNRLNQLFKDEDKPSVTNWFKPKPKEWKRRI